jgi:DNA-directed RNA polymerase-4/5 subunit 7
MSALGKIIFCEVELLRDVAVLTKNLDRNGLVSQRSIITRLLEDLLNEKASKDHGYFLAVTSLKSIGKEEVVDESGCFLPVVFNCRTFIPQGRDFTGKLFTAYLGRGSS